MNARSRRREARLSTFAEGSHSITQEWAADSCRDATRASIELFRAFRPSTAQAAMAQSRLSSRAAIVLIGALLLATVCGLRVGAAEAGLPSGAANAVASGLSLTPNGRFEQGDDDPAGWRLSGGQGRWVDRSLLEITGAGKGSAQWSAQCRFEPGGFYRFCMSARAVRGDGCVTSGPSFANHDWRLTPQWRECSYVFRAPDDAAEADVRLGHWEADGTFQFDHVEIVPVVPVHRVAPPLYPGAGEFTLGDGELIRQGRYRFAASFDGPAGMCHRPLVRATAPLNTNRWCFVDGKEVAYRFALPGALLNEVRIEASVCYRAGGRLLIEYSTDGEQWREAARAEAVGMVRAELPADTPPAGAVWLRLRGEDRRSNLQVDFLRVDARLLVASATQGPAVEPPAGAQAALQPPATDSSVSASASVAASTSASSAAKPIGMPDALGEVVIGRTLFAVWEEKAEGVGIDRIEYDPEASLLKLHLFGLPAAPLDVLAEVRADRGPQPLATALAEIGRQGRSSLHVALERLQPGTNHVAIAVNSQGRTLLRLGVPVAIHHYHRSDYGRLLPTGPAAQQAALWWCEAGWKVWPHRAAPAQTAAAIELEAARGDTEAAQLVVRPTTALRGLRAEVGPLVGPGGAQIEPSAVDLLRVAYHFVEHPTDGSSIVDWWPDALPPLDQPLDLPAGMSQPLWIRVTVPENAAAGEYRGTVTLRAEGFSAAAPLSVRVWNFNLPRRNHLATAFGLDVGNIWRYHRLKTEEEKRHVLDAYFRSFARARISPYNPAPLDPIRVRLLPEADPPRAEVDFTRFDVAWRRAIEQYRFTHFMLPLEGMGGGTFHERWEPKIGRFGADTHEYQQTFADYLGKIQRHLEEQGWISMAYTYWFDEPDPKDYAFVREGMERIKRYAPKLTNMLTEEPNEALAGAIDIWCPVTENYRHDEAQRRIAAGEKLWWYVCCGPKAPYCTLFIDHPATELRTWLWQSWQRNISGILIWSSNYWTSSTAFPDSLQNPYADPMSYVSGYGVPKGTKQFWGNGDGRFLYPPPEAAAGRTEGPPITAGPVESIRWEMLREGIEDWEMLYLLRDRLDRAGVNDPRLRQLLEVPEEITRSLTEFTVDPAPIHHHRRRVAEAIERLGRE